MIEHLLKERTLRARKILKVLKALFPDAKIALRYSNPWELVVAVRLSAQCTDKKVNEVTFPLFKKYLTLEDYAKANLAQFEQDIKPAGFYRSKAKSILDAAKIIKEKFGGNVPSTMEELTSLPGIGRKSANVILGNAFGKTQEGIAVDTHVMRLSQKLGLTAEKDPVSIEKDLMEILPRKDWFFFTYGSIEYGRQICPRRKHKDCSEHPFTKLYPKAADLWP